jgi:hypothetical protein
MEDVKKNLVSACPPIWLTILIEPLYSASLPSVDVHILGAGGSNYFPLSYSGSNRDGGC